MSLRGTNQEAGRPYNRRIVLEAIRTWSPISRAAIARRIGLTLQTVSTIARELEEAGFITGAPMQPKGRGQPPVALKLNPEGCFAIGLHVTPIGIEAALVNVAGEIVGRHALAVRHGEPDAVFGEIEHVTGELSRLSPERRVIGAGMAIPGPFGVESMSFVGPTTLEGWSGIAIKERLAAATGLAAFVEADVAAAALGERLYGLGRSYRDFYFLYFGAGLGGTMVHEGQALRGAHGNAGELGHLPVVPGGAQCPCGNRGCLELYLSLDSLHRFLAEGGGDADRWVALAAPFMRTAAVAIENFFDPETIIVGGLAPPELIGKLLVAAEPLPHSVADRAGRGARRIMVSEQGKDAVLRGAAALAVSGVLSPRAEAMTIADGTRDDPLLAPRGGREAA